MFFQISKNKLLLCFATSFFPSILAKDSSSESSGIQLNQLSFSEDSGILMNRNDQIFGTSNRHNNAAKNRYTSFNESASHFEIDHKIVNQKKERSKKPKTFTRQAKYI